MIKIITSVSKTEDGMRGGVLRGLIDWAETSGPQY